MLQFDDRNELGPTSGSILETNKHVSFTSVHETEMTSDNISDQQSESESAIGSCSLQDSNLILQLTTIQDLNFQADMMIQSNGLDEVDTTIAVPKSEKNSKKRTLSVSSISGLERAQFEANQKGRKKNHHKDWESVRRDVLGTYTKENPSSQRLRRQDHEDSVDWDAVRLAQLGELAETIKERGMHHVLSGRIKVNPLCHVLNYFQELNEILLSSFNYVGLVEHVVPIPRAALVLGNFFKGAVRDTIRCYIVIREASVHLQNHNEGL